MIGVGINLVKVGVLGGDAGVALGSGPTTQGQPIGLLLILTKAN